MWAIEAFPGLKVAYRGGWYHFIPGYTTISLMDVNKAISIKAKVKAKALIPKAKAKDY